MRQMPWIIMGTLWVILVAALGLGYLQNRRELERRHRLGETLTRTYGYGVPLVEPGHVAEAGAACERAAKGNPSDPAVWSVWALVQAQGVLLSGDDPAAWSRSHRVASQLVGQDRSGIDPGTRVRLAASRILQRAATAETRGELIENLHEALRQWDAWPGSSLLQNAALWAAVSAGQAAYVAPRLPDPADPLHWPLLMDWHLSRERFAEASALLDRWERHAPGHPMPRLQRAWIACRTGTPVSVPPAPAEGEPPVLRAWTRLARACALSVGGEKAEAVRAELEKAPLLPHDAVLFGLMRLAQESGAQDLYRQVREEFTKRRGRADERLDRLDALENLARLDPEKAYAFHSRQDDGKQEPAAVWSALLTGRKTEARAWARPGDPRWPEAVFREDLSEEELAILERQSGPPPTGLWWSALWAREAMDSLGRLEWGTLAHEQRLEAIRSKLARLPEDSPLTARLAARLALEQDRSADAARNLARLCGEDPARVEDDLGLCRSLRGPLADVELVARFLTAEEARPIDFPSAQERLERLLPTLSSPGRPVADALFWRLRHLRLQLRAQPGQGRLVEEKLGTLAIPPSLVDPEALTEAALLHLYLGKREAAAALLRRLGTPPPRTVLRLAHHALQLQDPASAQTYLAPALARADLAPRVRQVLRVLRAQAGLLQRQDVTAEFEELFRLDPCPEMAEATIRAYLTRGRRTDCQRLRELIAKFIDKGPGLERASAEIDRFCAGP
jgi:hypothetical protein